MSKKKITIIIVVIFILLVLFLIYLNSSFKQKIEHLYGIYECDGKSLVVKDIILFNKIEGVIKSTDLNMAFDGHLFTEFRYPTNKKEIENGLFQETEMSEYEKKEYIKKITVNNITLDYNDQFKNVDPVDLISLKNVDNNTFIQLQGCINSNYANIYKDIKKPIKEGNLNHTRNNIYLRNIYNVEVDHELK